MKANLLVLLAGIALLVAVTGCRHTSSLKYTDLGAPADEPAPKLTPVEKTSGIPAEWLQPPTNLFTLGPGDRLEIELLDETNSLVTTVVGPDGKVYFNLLPGIDVWGLDLGQARSLMERGLKEYVRGEPRVGLTLRGVESKRVWLLGRFQQPGVYIMTNAMTLLEAVAAAGGSLTFSGAREVAAGPISEDLADLRHSFIVRQGQILPVDFHRLLNEGDLSQNIYLHPDDFVYFTPAYAREVHVLGAVTQPQAVPYTEGMTVATAIAGAYGWIQDAYLDHVAVLRGSFSEPQIAVVNLRAITSGREQDMVLEPNDIVYVPFAPYRYLRKYADIILNTFVSSVAINAGTSAVIKDGGAGAGIFIPIGSGVQIIPPPAPPIGGR
jgi:protein involved in polysaccharide export with SLBB domain